MSDRQKTVVAAILAVHSGHMSPDEAVALLESPEIPATLVEPGAIAPTVRLRGGDVPIGDVLSDPEKQRQALMEIGIGEEAQHTLFSIGAGNAGGNEMRVIRDTLNTVATAGRRLAADEEFEPATDVSSIDHKTRAPSETGRRTLKLTTGKFFPSFGDYGEKRYEMRKEHARGGMGRVMVAKDLAVGREVALKELLPGMASGASIPASVPAGVSESGGIVERFLREARITGQLEHPNIVPVYEIGRYDDGSFYYTMRFIRGKTLAERLREIRKDDTLDRRGKLAARIRLLDQFIDVCNAIAYAHSKGVVHRDIKPDNIMLGDYGETLVLDWGLARLKGQEDKALQDLQRGTVALSQSLIESDSDALTLDGSIVGTPAYMAPEQARGELDKVDEQSDVYALGAVLYQILTGLPPYEGPMASLIVQAVLAGPPRSVRSREPHVPPELEALVEAAMAREKSERLKSAFELAGEVKAFRDGRTLGSYAYSKREMVARFVHQNRTPVGIATLGVLLVIMATVFFMQRLAVERDEAMAAHADAEKQRENAMQSLRLAQQERTERERLENEALERERSNYALRLREAEQLLGTIEGMRIEPALQDLDSRLARYDAELRGPPEREIIELSADEQIGNGVLLSNVLGYISARQNLLLLLEGPVGAELPEVFQRFDMEAERRKLDDLRARTARLARFNGDFTLAEFLLSGSALDAELIRRERAAIQSARKALLGLHAQRIHEALDDLRAGIGRAGRDPGAPTVDEYARRLSQYRNEQTVDILASELERLKTKPQHAWERSDIHIAVLVCRVFGRIEQPSRVVPLLAAFLDRVNLPEAVDAATAALGETASAEGALALIAQYHRRGLDYLDRAAPLIERAPMPPQLRNPQSPRDFLDLAIVRRSRGDAVGAIDAATRALNLGEESDQVLMVRALARADAGLRDEALADMDMLIQRDSENYEAWLVRAAVRDVLMDGDAALQDLESAIDLEPENPRAYLRRAEVLFTRARLVESVADLRRAVELAPLNIEYRLALGERLRALGRSAYAEAEAEFTRVIEQAPDDWRGWSARCVLRRDTGFGGCIGDGQEATRLNPRDGRAFSYMAQAYYGLGRITEGIEAATNAVTVDPDRWLAFYYRGILYLRLQDAEDSRARSNPGDVTTVDARRVTLERAVSDFRSAVAVNPQDYRSWALMADTLVQLDRHEEARPAAIEALKLAPFNGDQSTTGMGNYVVRLALLEIEGAAWASRQPDGIPAMVRLAHYHLRRAARPRASLNEARAAIRLLTQARSAMDETTPLRDRYEHRVAEDRLMLQLIGSEHFLEAVRIAEARASGSALDYLRYARALVGLAGQYTDASVKFLEADAEAMAGAQAEFRTISVGQRRERAVELISTAFAALHAAVEAGFKDEAAVANDAQLRALQGDERWEEWMEALRASTAEPPADPGMASPVAAISYVQEGGPAWNAGMRAGDVLAEVAGAAVINRQEVTARLRALAPGEEYIIKVRRYPLRDGRLLLRTDQDGKPLLDEAGMPAWRYTEHELTLKAGFLGVRIEDGELPSPLDP